MTRLNLGFELSGDVIGDLRKFRVARKMSQMGGRCNRRKPARCGKPLEIHLVKRAYLG
jgi:hypothetical protein